MKQMITIFAIIVLLCLSQISYAQNSCNAPTLLYCGFDRDATVTLNWNNPFEDTVYSEGFELPLIDSMSFGWEQTDMFTAHQGGFSLGSNLASGLTYDTNGYINNWFYLPPIQLINNSVLKFWVSNQGGNGSDGYLAVYISTTSPTENFTLLHIDFSFDSTWQQKILDLSNYHGVVYIAFRHYTNGNLPGMCIDDIKVMTSQQGTYNVYRNDDLLADHVINHWFEDSTTQYLQTYCYKISSICLNNNESVLSNEMCVALPPESICLYVTETGAGTRNGSSWENATSDLQWAIDTLNGLASCHKNIWVAAGTYYGDGISAHAFTMAPGVNVYGGFAGNEPADYNLALRDFETNASVLDGQNVQRVLYQSAGFTSTTSAVWDGFTIQWGNALSNNSSGYGAGVYMKGYATLQNCKVVNNSAYGRGAGIYAYGLSQTNSTIIKQCEVSYNVSQSSAGGIYAYYADISRCKISENQSASSGGGVCLIYSNLINSEISDNESNRNAGGVYVDEVSTIINCDIVNNSSEWIGGGVYSFSANNTFINCIIWGNKRGGLVDNLSGTATVTYCAVENGYEGMGNINLHSNNDNMNVMNDYVRFIGQAVQNYHLHSTSACVNRGTHNLPASIPLYDLDGNPRIYGDSIDMGCYEYQGDTIYCIALSNLTVSNITGVSAYLSWSDNEFSDIVDYVVAYKEENSDNWVFDTVQNSFTFLSQLTPSTSYVVKVLTRCSCLQNGVWSESVLFNTTDCMAGMFNDIFIVGENPESNTNGDVIPTNFYYNYSYSQQIFTADEIGRAQLIDYLTWQYFYPLEITRNITIYMGTTPKSNFTGSADWIPASELTEVFSGNITFTNRNNNLVPINFTNSFFYNGTDNLVIAVDDNTNDYVSSENKFYTHPTSERRTIYAYRDNADILLASPPTGTIIASRNNIILPGGCDSSACQSPILVVREITDSSASLIWVGTPEAGSYEMYYKSEFDSVFITFNASDMQYTLNNLSMNTEYTVAIRSVCGEDEIGNWTELTFTTEVLPLERLYVSETGSGDKFGSSWDNATDDLQWALNTATEITALYGFYPDIWVAAGTYYGDSISANAFTMAPGVNVYGGFAGNEPADYNLALRDFETNASVLDGQNVQRVLYQSADFTSTTSAVWDGFTIQRGNALSNNSSGYGAGVYMKGYAILQNCKVVNNSAYGRGAGIYAYGLSQTNSTIIKQCEVSYNVSQSSAGGIYAYYADISRCKISENQSAASGGGVCLIYSNLINSEISDNESNRNAGGVYVDEVSTIINCDIVNNKSMSSGGGVYSTSANNTFINCIIWGNKQGGLVDNLSGTATVTYCAVENGYEGMGNINLHSNNDNMNVMNDYVRFIGQAVQNYHLHSTSACVNRGTHNLPASILLYDLDGNPRIYGDSIDMGCYEYQGDTYYCIASSNLTVSNITGVSAYLSWSDNEFSDIVDYVVAYKEENSDNWVFDTVQNSFTFLSQLTPSTSYVVKVLTRCSCLQNGVWSESVLFNTTDCMGRMFNDMFIVGENPESNTYGNVIPTNFYYNYSYSQQIFTADEIGRAQWIDYLTWQYFYPLEITRNITIYMGTTPKSNFTGSADWIPASELTEVFSGNITFTNRNNNLVPINFTNSFFYNGTDNLVIAVDDNTNDYVSSENKFYTHPTSERRTIYAYRDNADILLASPPTGTIIASRNNIIIPGGCDTSACQPPTLVVGEITDSSASLIWLGTPEVSSYEMYYKSEFDSVFITFNASDMQYTLNNLSMNTEYTVAMRSVCGEDEIGNWTELTFTTEVLPLERLYVSETGSGDHSGSSWDNACQDLQWALNTATEIKALYGFYPDIWVAAGTYYGDSISAHAFTMAPGVNVYGGFAGNEPADYNLALRDFETNVSVLDGQNVQRVLYQSADFTSTTSAVWDGFTIQRGNALSNNSNGYGAGVYMRGSATLQNCKVVNNRAYGLGGGIYVYGLSQTNSTIIKQCEVSHNVSQSYAGGIYAYYADISRCKISENQSVDIGGGVYLNYSNISNSVVFDNESNGYRGGGVYAYFFSTIINCDIVNNKSMSSGGGVYSTSANNTFINCIIWGNKQGGLVDNLSGTATVTYCAVENGYEGMGNINLHSNNDNMNVMNDYVRFIGQAVQNYHLHSTSACVNRGTHNLPASIPLYDLDGNPRIYGDSIDMGCYEYQGDTIYCIALSNLTVSNITGVSAYLSWSDNEFSDIVDYVVAYKEENSDNWVFDTVQNSFTFLSQLTPSTSYVVKVLTRCSCLQNGVWSESVLFNTTDCMAGMFNDIFIVGENPESNTNGDVIPTNFYYNYSYSQQIFTADEIGRAQLIDYLTWQYFYPLEITRNITIYMGTTPKSNFTGSADWIPASELTEVFSGNITFTNRNNNLVPINFTNSFFYNGTDNLVIAVDDNTNSKVNVFMFYTHPTYESRTIYAYRDEEDILLASPPTGTIVAYRNNIIIPGGCDSSACQFPTLVVREITDSSASLIWSGTPEVSSYEMYYKSEFDSVFITFNASDMQYTLYNLSMNTEYTVAMRSVCGDDENSNWTRLTFTTELLPLERLYVSETGSGDHSGSSWDNACQDLQWALNTAAEIKALYGFYPDIWVSAGIYYGDGISTNAFTMAPGVNVYGGFAGNEPADYNLALRDFETNVSVLDGQNAQRVLYQSDHFTSTTSAVWDGFTIQRGNALDNNSNGYGAGVYMKGYATLQNCKVVNNRAYGHGGGIYVSGFNQTNPTIIKRCEISHNVSESDGGGICAWCADIRRCKISENQSASDGGGVYLSYSNISNSEISDNESNDDGGGVYVSYSSTVINCDIINNKSISRGGGVNSYNNNNTFKNCIIWGNKQGYIVDNLFSTGSTTVTYCAVEESVPDGVGNIVLASNNDGNNPAFYYVRFMDVSNHNYQLHPTSSCVNVGDPEYELIDTLDLLGNPRVHGYAVDLGCYESAGDFSCLSVINLQATDVGNHSAVLSWCPIGEENQWLISLDLVDGHNSTSILANDTVYTLTDLIQNRNYTVRVKAICDSVTQSIYSIPITFYTLCDTSSLTLSDFDDNFMPIDSETVYQENVTFTWAIIPEATSYDFYLWLTGEDMPDIPTASQLLTNGISINLPNFDYGKEYLWKVVAHNECITKTSPIISLKVNNLPNLHVTQISHSNPIAGQTMTVEWNVRNDGEGRTPPGTTWSDYIWISTVDGVGGGFWYGVEEELLATIPNLTSLNPGESYRNTAQVTIPQSYIGNYYLFVMSDQASVVNIDYQPTDGTTAPIPYTPNISGTPYPFLYSQTTSFPGNFIHSRMKETNESDNFFYEFVSVLPPPSPDLVVSHISHPLNTFSGISIPLTYIIKNQGEAFARDNWTDAVYISTESTFDATNAVHLGNFSCSSTPLAIDSSYSRTVQVSVPLSYSGSYYLFVVTDIADNVYEGLSNDNNISVSETAIQVTMTPPPDLAVTELSVPEVISVNGNYTIHYTVKNQGANPVSESAWYDAVYLLPSNEWNEQDARLLKTTRHNNNNTPLAIDSSYSCELPISITDLISGEWFLFVKIDKDNEVFEYINEDNNLRCADHASQIVAPDLAVLNVEIDDTVNLNTPLTSTWTVKNVGQGLVYRQYITNHIRLNDEFVIVDSMYVPLMNSGDSIILSKIIQLPCTNLPTGQLIVSTNSSNSIYEAGSVANNLTTKELTYITPELSVDSVQMTDHVSSGEWVEMTWILRNTGTAPIIEKAIKEAVYCTTNPNYLQQIMVDTFSRMVSIGVNEEIMVHRTVMIPDGIQGTYYFTVITNQLDHPVCEGLNTASNVSGSDAVNVTLSPYPDLTITSLTITNDTVYSGSSFMINYTTHNSGIANVSNRTWKDRFYLTPGPVFNAATAILLGDNIQTSSINIDENVVQSVSFVIPQSVNIGSYYLFANIDADNQVYEYMGENNNSFVSDRITVTIYPLDISIQQIDVASTIEWGQNVQCTMQIANSSNVPTLRESWNDMLYLSSDNVLSNNDIQLNLFNHIGHLLPNSSYQNQRLFTVPYGMSGRCYLIGICDFAGVNPDVNVQNNIFYKEITINSVPVADLSVSEVEVLGNVVSGQPVQIAYTVTNESDVSIPRANWNDKIFLSNDNEYGTNDLEIRNVLKNRELAAHSSYRDTVSITVPLPNSGVRYLIVKANANHSFYENNQDNNVLAHLVSVVFPLPGDLIVENVVCESEVISGEYLHAEWRIRNIGENILSGRDLRSLVYMSVDTLFDVNDKLLGMAIDNILLPSHTSVVQSMVARISGVSEGNYYLIVKTDVTNAFNETDDQNNSAYSAYPFTVSLRNLPFNTSLYDTLNNNLANDYKLSVGNNIHETVRIHFHSEDSLNGAVNMIYVNHNAVGTNLNYTYSTIGQYSANPELYIPSSQLEYYGINVTGHTPIDSAQSMYIRADILPFELRAVSPNYGGNTGRVTVELTGSKFRNDMTVWLMNANDTIYADTILFESYYRVFAIFDLTGKTEGLYTVGALNLCAGEDFLENAFEIRAGIPENLATNLVIPNSPRPNRTIILMIEYGNIGNVDIYNPVIRLNSLGGSWISTTSDGINDQLQFIDIPLQIENDPQGVLRPGATGTVNIYCYTNDGLIFTIKRIR